MHRHSALETIYKVGKYSSSEKQSLTFKELKSLEILQIACWPDKIDEMNNLNLKDIKMKCKEMKLKRSGTKDELINSVLKKILNFEELYLEFESPLEVED